MGSEDGCVSYADRTTYVGKENIFDCYVDEKDWKQRLKPLSNVFWYKMYKEGRDG